MTYFLLWLEFIKIGFFAIGGGLATLPFLQDLSERTQWFSLNDIANMIAVSEATPGAVGVNMATYTGYMTGGVLGAVIATCGLIMPPIGIILLISGILNRYRTNKLVNQILCALRPASMALICQAGLLVLQNGLLDMENFNAGGPLQGLFRWKEIMIALILGVIWKKSKVHPVIFIFIAGFLGAI